MNAKVTLNLPPVGIKIIRNNPDSLEGIERFNGISYCQGINRATGGKELLITPESISVCKWAPVVLGFKKAVNDFEKSITEHLDYGTRGVYAAPVHLFRKDMVPDVVIIRTDSENYRKIIDILGWESFISSAGRNQDMTSLNSFRSEPPGPVSLWMIKNVNRLLDFMNRFDWWQGFTAFLFRSTLVTRIFDRFITRFMANMSMCRNSTVIPYRYGKANISYFCTGGIAWGKNTPGFMTSGYPITVFRKLEPNLDYPGKG